MAKLKLAKAKDSEFVSHAQKKQYKVLIVDDEQSIHDVTGSAVGSMDFLNYDVQLLHALSAQEAKEVLAQHNDIAMALVDVVMETPEAGLELIDYIRNQQKNLNIRLIIRTGQANNFSQMEIVKKYDINDFKEKTELTIERLYTTIRSAVKQYEQIIELEQKYEETYRQLTTNSLTKLPNRLKLLENFATQENKTLVLIDIVSFSVINETNGFEVGDYILKEFGAFLYSMYHDDFDVYHLHSDVFGLVPKSKDIAKLEDHLQRIKEDISRVHFVTNNYNKTIDTTIGVAYKSNKDVIKKAELALKEARNNGKNKIQFYNTDLKIIKHIEQVSYWAPIIKRALENQELLAYAQPIFDVNSGEIYKYELLVRLKHEDVVYTPFHFLEAATASGQLFQIFKFMFEQGCRVAKETGRKLSINVGDGDLNEPEIVSFIESMLDKYEVDPSLLTLELLEYKSIEESQKEAILKIHQLGVRFAVDDFGVQCSNFAQIENIPIDLIKIDGSFIKNIHQSKNNLIIVKTIVAFARETQMKVVAEFVCNKEVYDVVKELGIDYAQGFYLAEPALELQGEGSI